MVARFVVLVALLVRVSPNADGVKLLKTRAHPYIEQAAVTSLNAEPISAVSVADNIKQVWHVAVVVIAGDGSLRSFGGTFTKSATNC